MVVDHKRLMQKRCHPTLKRAVWSLGVCFLLLLTGCGATSNNGPSAVSSATSLVQPAKGTLSVACPAANRPLPGPIVFGSNGNLMVVGPDGPATPLTTLGATFTAHDPAWSPDGQTLAFTYTQPASNPDLPWLQLGVICGLDRATGQARLLAQPADPLASFDEAAWLPDGQGLLLTLREPQRNTSNQYLGDQLTLARYLLQTGSLEPLIQNASSPSLSPDGQRLMFLRTDPEQFTRTLMQADSDGSRAQPLGVAQQNLLDYFAPRWSPNGQQIVFVASSAALGSETQPDTLSLLERLLGVRVARAHGNPADLWLAGADGKGLWRVTNLLLDDPRAAWSPDGKALVYSAGPDAGVVVLPLDGGQERQLTEHGNYGGIAWASR